MKRILPLIFLLVCAPLQAAQKRVIYQLSTIGALMNGVYDGNISLGEIRRYGDFGLGTFNHLDGEMILLDGKFYQVPEDGKVVEASSATLTPLAMVTFFKPEGSYEVREAASLTDFQHTLTQVLPTKNQPYTIRVEGFFKDIKVRVIPAQTQPYPTLVEAAKLQKVYTHSYIEGTLVGFWSPSYFKNIGVDGFHFHFLAKNKAVGGHVLDCTIADGKVQWQGADMFLLEIPQDSEFQSTPLDQDHSRDIQAVEK